MRWVAFLRGINLGKRRLSMDRLRAAFEDLGFDRVSTYIASGNVIFDSDSDSDDRSDLEAKIRAHLLGSLGFDVATYLRTIPELRAILDAQPFSKADAETKGHKIHVNFLETEPPGGSDERLKTLNTEYDGFALIGREMYWLTRGGLSGSKVRDRQISEALGGIDGSMRNMNTVRSIVEKYGTEV